LNGEDIASGLQLLYPEYGRKKKQGFKLLVGKIYSSLCHRNQLEFAPAKLPQGEDDSEKEQFRDRVKDCDSSSSVAGRDE